MTIEIKHRVLTTVGATHIELPYRFKTDEYYYAQEVIMITQDFEVVKVHLSDGHNSMSITKRDIAFVEEFIEDKFRKNNATEITAEEFNEKLNEFIKHTTHIQ